MYLVVYIIYINDARSSKYEVLICVINIYYNCETVKIF